MKPESCELNSEQMQTASSEDAVSTVGAESTDLTESHRSGLNRRPPPYNSAESGHVCSSLNSSDDARGVHESPRMGGELATTTANISEQGHSAGENVAEEGDDPPSRLAADCPPDAEPVADEPHLDASDRVIDALSGALQKQIDLHRQQIVGARLLAYYAGCVDSLPELTDAEREEVLRRSIAYARDNFAGGESRPFPLDFLALSHLESGR